MALINFSLGEIIGKMGGVVFQRGSAGSVLRKNTVPVNPSTPLQTRSRERMAGLAKTWSNTLTQLQRDAWGSLASTSTLLNVFGNPINRTGFMLFTELNTARLIFGSALLLDAPDNLDMVILDNPQFGEHIIDDPGFEVVIGTALVANQYIWVEGLMNQSQAVSYVADKLSFFDAGIDLNLQGYTVTIPSGKGRARDGRLDYIRVRGYNDVNGVLSPGVIVSALPTI